MSVTTAVPSRLKASEGRRIAPTKSAFEARYSRMAAFCLSSVKWLVTRASTPPGFRASMDLAKKKSCRRQLLPAIVELEVGERHVADHRVDAVLGQARVAEVLDADVLSGWSALAMRPEMRVQLDADEAHPWPALAHEIARCRSPAPGRWRCRERPGGRWPRAWPR